MDVKTIKDLNLTNKKLFMRVDFNVPIRDGQVQDDTRIVQAIPTIEFAKKNKAKVILASHLGRPKGEKKLEDSLKPVADYISKNFFKVNFIFDCIGDKVEAEIAKMRDGEVVLLENLRFYKGEEKNDPEFVEKLGRFTEVYVNDAFGTSHREHASVYGLPLTLKEKGVGFLMGKEVTALSKVLYSPDRPFAAILGGAKVSDKIGVLEALIEKVDKLFIGGAMAYTFLKYRGNRVGKSLIEVNQLPSVELILNKANDRGVKVFLPVDHIASENMEGRPIIVNKIDIDDNLMALDIGEKTITEFKSNLKDCKTIMWNGPMGVFEKKDYAAGTFEIAKYISTLKAFTVVGGGDSVSAVKKSGVASNISHISTGGGASLEFIEKGGLPCIDILRY